MISFLKVAITSGTLLVLAVLFGMVILFEVVEKGTSNYFYYGLIGFIITITILVAYLRKTFK